MNFFRKRPTDAYTGAPAAPGERPPRMPSNVNPPMASASLTQKHQEERLSALENEARRALLERIEGALIVAARLVEYGGDKYLPIFERLERERAGLEEKRSAIERARAIARAAG